MASTEAVNTTSKSSKIPKAPKRGKRSTVSAIFEVLTFTATQGDAGQEAVSKLVKLNPSKNVVRMALMKLHKAGQKDHSDVLLRASDRMGYAFRGTTYVVGKNGRLIIPVDAAFKAGARVVVTREAGCITVRDAS